MQAAQDVTERISSDKLVDITRVIAFNRKDTLSRSSRILEQKILSSRNVVHNDLNAKFVYGEKHRNYLLS